MMDRTTPYTAPPALPDLDADIAVIGAGPAGLAFARAMAGSGLSLLLIERSAEQDLADPAPDGREIALTHRSVRGLEALDAWARIPAAETSPLRRARVLNGTSPLTLTFEAAGVAAPALGTLVPNHLIRRALWQSVQAAGCARILAGTTAALVQTGPTGGVLRLGDGRRVTARLVVAADTRFSDARRQCGIAASLRDFGRTMLVARVAHPVPHDGVATEWFGHGQTVAMLPLPGAVSSLVLTLPAQEITRLMALDEPAFNGEVTRRTQGRWGDLRLLGPRHAYPLVATYAERFVAPRFALVGDAAVGMHPVTAHGFNFGLAGAQRLAGEIRAALARGGNPGDPGDPGALLRYEMGHRAATGPLFAATNALAALYTDDSAPARLVRGAVMRLGALAAPVRRLVTAQLMQAGPT